MRRKILVISTAMILAAQLGSPVSAATPTTEQLSAIAHYLEVNDVEGLRQYLDVYPELTEGDSTLAVLLRRFLVESVAANRFFSFRPNLEDAVVALAEPSVAASDDSPDASAGPPDDPPDAVY